MQAGIIIYKKFDDGGILAARTTRPKSQVSILIFCDWDLGQFYYVCEILRDYR
ncbi:11967_t:CDS:1, partial [Dentiscutata heterogama]